MTPDTTSNATSSNTKPAPIDEIRSYHYNPELFEGYKDWAQNHALPYLREHLNLIGFWLDAGVAPEVGGEQPADMPLGVANVTWIIRWDSLESRAEALPRVFGTEEFQAILARIPDVKGYFQMESRFTYPV